MLLFVPSQTLPEATTVLPYVWLPSVPTHLMFLALDAFHSPVLRSKSPGAQSVTIPSAIGVLLRSEVPPH